MKGKSVWSTILKVVIAVATAIAGVVGISSCIGGWGWLIWLLSTVPPQRRTGTLPNRIWRCATAGVEWNGPGYHFYIRKNGDIKTTRPIEKIGAHARGHNAQSIGICYEGGISERGRLADTRTVWQKHSLRVLVRALLVDYPGCKVCGHRDLSPDLNGNGEIEPEEWVKQCPCFDVSKEKYSK